MQTVESWSVEEVVSFITSLGGSAAKYASAFRDNQVTGGLLLELEDADLEGNYFHQIVRVTIH